MYRSLFAACLLLAVLFGASPTFAKTAIYGSPVGDVGWCTGYDVTDEARTCARNECESVATEECFLLAFCTNSGWGATASDEASGAAGAACGRATPGNAAAVALAECAKAAGTFCDVTDTFKNNGDVATKDENITYEARFYHQLLLALIGYYDSSIDMEWGPKSRAALLRYQREHSDRLAVTGEPSAFSFLALLDEVGEQNFIRHLMVSGDPAIAEHPEASAGIPGTVAAAPAAPAAPPSQSATAGVGTLKNSSAKPASPQTQSPHDDFASALGFDPNDPFDQVFMHLETAPTPPAKPATSPKPTTAAVPVKPALPAARTDAATLELQRAFPAMVTAMTRGFSEEYGFRFGSSAAKCSSVQGQAWRGICTAFADDLRRPGMQADAMVFLFARDQGFETVRKLVEDELVGYATSYGTEWYTDGEINKDEFTGLPAGTVTMRSYCRQQIGKRNSDVVCIGEITDRAILMIRLPPGQTSTSVKPTQYTDELARGRLFLFDAGFPLVKNGGLPGNLQVSAK